MKAPLSGEEEEEEEDDDDDDDFLPPPRLPLPLAGCLLRPAVWFRRERAPKTGLTADRCGMYVEV